FNKNKMESIKRNLSYLKKRIVHICPNRRVVIVVVTKLVEVDKVEEVIKQNIKNIGESKVQEAERKFSFLQKDKVKYHLIGHLQTNKVKTVVRLFDLIQSVDSYSLAYEINKEAEKINKVQDILLQVNTSKEKNKYGFFEEEVLNLIERLASMFNLSIKGLMTIAPFVSEEDRLRDCFKRLRNLQTKISKLNIKGLKLKYLSMGMSNDYEIALQEGANMIRVGNAIFN
ncbi:YggS family pyridoxal phosphate-dependent enzyme, partial [bacterium]|nr:YggS family pyridoxal phosphate-dependent enzyme [bacterium]